MGKSNYILRSLSKISNKRWEHYVINRLFHRLDDPDIEFVCQQCVRKKDGKIYLADLFFPQLGAYLEIDEGHHQADDAKIRDAKRRFDIAEVAKLEEHRISVFDATIEKIDTEIELFIDYVRKRKFDLMKEGGFRAWNYEHRFMADPHIETGSIEVGPYAAFRTHKEALRCFGYRKGHFQRSTWNLPPNVRDTIGLEGSCMVWFPKLYEQAEWINSLSDDGKLITETNKNPEHTYEEPWDTRIVIARSRDELNRILYRFVGVFKVVEEHRTGNTHKFIRINTAVKTYPANRA